MKDSSDYVYLDERFNDRYLHEYLMDYPYKNEISIYGSYLEIYSIWEMYNPRPAEVESYDRKRKLIPHRINDLEWNINLLTVARYRDYQDSNYANGIFITELYINVCFTKEDSGKILQGEK